MQKNNNETRKTVNRINCKKIEGDRICSTINSALV